jgi:hypothetical protein
MASPWKTYRHKLQNLLVEPLNTSARPDQLAGHEISSRPARQHQLFVH